MAQNGAADKRDEQAPTLTLTTMVDVTITTTTPDPLGETSRLLVHFLSSRFGSRGLQVLLRRAG